MSDLPDWRNDTIKICVAAVLVLLNGFFVAAEFALVKVRGGRLGALVRAGKPFANTATWLSERLDSSLATCQLGITMTSLGLGWIAEPAFASWLRHAFHTLGIESEVTLHTVAFVVAFTAITASVPAALRGNQRGRRPRAPSYRR
jgi:CBS domain containing-hemolysin-like protein